MFEKLFLSSVDRQLIKKLRISGPLYITFEFEGRILVDTGLNDKWRTEFAKSAERKDRLVSTIQGGIRSRLIYAVDDA